MGVGWLLLVAQSTVWLQPQIVGFYHFNLSLHFFLNHSKMVFFFGAYQRNGLPCCTCSASSANSMHVVFG